MDADEAGGKESEEEEEGGVEANNLSELSKDRKNSNPPRFGPSSPRMFNKKKEC